MTSGHYILWTLFRIFIVIVLILAVFAIGAMIGYGMLGGGKATDVFKPELWHHIFSFF